MRTKRDLNAKSIQEVERAQRVWKAERAPRTALRSRTDLSERERARLRQFLGLDSDAPYRSTFRSANGPVTIVLELSAADFLSLMEAYAYRDDSLIQERKQRAAVKEPEGKR